MILQVSPGYKLTEVGIIPEDWEAKTIGEIASFSGGSQPPRSTFCFSAKPGFIRLIQIRDYKSDAFETYIPTVLAQKTCTAEDVMIGRYGPPIFQILKGIDGAYNVALIKTIPTQKVDSVFWYYFLKQEKLFNFIELLSRRSSGQTGVEMPALKAYGLPLPPLKEQRAIATTLADIDALISGLDQLISKKLNIKQAAMQQLLTGQRRLPGFSGEWEERRLGDVLEKIVGGGTPSRSNEKYWNGEIPWVTVKDFATFNPRAAQETITREGLKSSASNLIPSETLITSTRMALGKAVIYEVDVSINQDLKALFPKKNVCTKFLYYWFENNAAIIDELGSGSTVKGISLGDLKAITFLLSSLEEQTAIATILSDMDNELATLEMRCDKARQLKQGMMQELLTGRIRLSQNSQEAK